MTTPVCELVELVSLEIVLVVGAGSIGGAGSVVVKYGYHSARDIITSEANVTTVNEFSSLTVPATNTRTGLFHSAIKTSLDGKVTQGVCV